MRKVFAREEPVTTAGRQLPLTLPGTRFGKPLKSIVHPLRTTSPDPSWAPTGTKNVA